jgi:hypothetical protein
LTRQCLQCDTEYYARRQSRFCSRRCSARHNVALGILPKAPRHRPDMIGNKLGVKRPVSAEYRALRLAVAKRNWQAGALKGVPAWNKGQRWPREIREKTDRPRFGQGRKANPITRVRFLVRNSNLYAKWHAQVLIRDSFTCVFCYAKIMRGRKVILHVDDYPDTFVSIIEPNGITRYEEAVNCKRLWDINNGRTLCLPCHKLRHKNSNG